MIITPIKTHLPISTQRLAFELENRADIDAFWQHKLANNPRLWNGPFFLFTDVQCADGLLSGKAQPTDFATFLYYRDQNRDPMITHITGTSLMMTSDGALVGMEMAAHTANGGKKYFPAGSFDPADVVDGQLDPLTNVRRELAEETGLVLAPSDFDRPSIGTFADDTWHVALPCKLPMSFEQVQSHMRRHQAETGDDELAGLVGVRSVADAQQMLPFARALAAHALTIGI